jgi:integrase/recombinase XerD
MAREQARDYMNFVPHVLRHSLAMDFLQHGVDRSVIALWLGHESVQTTQIYLHADMRLKEQAGGIYRR